MNLILRQETYNDYSAVGQIIKAAFENDPHGDHSEHLLVERLRKSNSFTPQLSIVAEMEGEIVGHILLTKIEIKNGQESFGSLALAPVSVTPAFQRQGIGGKLILAAHEHAKKLGFKSIILLGHENYYPRFGYRKASGYNIQLPFEAPDENCMAIELIENGLKGVSGLVEYPKTFFEEIETWDLYNKSGIKTGETIQRGDPLPPDRYHLIIHFWIRNNLGEYLIQKRSENVKSNPGIWSVTGGSAIAGETSGEAVQREVMEEIGFLLPFDEVKKINRIFGKNYFLDVFLLIKDVPIETFIVGEEVSAVKYIHPTELMSMREKGLFWDLGDAYFEKLFE